MGQGPVSGLITGGPDQGLAPPGTCLWPVRPTKLITCEAWVVVAWHPGILWVLGTSHFASLAPWLPTDAGSTDCSFARGGIGPGHPMEAALLFLRACAGAAGGSEVRVGGAVFQPPHSADLQHGARVPPQVRPQRCEGAVGESEQGLLGPAWLPGFVPDRKWESPACWG